MSDLLLQAMFVLGLSLVGGLATYMQGVMVLHSQRSLARLFLEFLYSLLACFGVWFLCMSGEVDIWLTLFFVLVAGLNGAEVLRNSKQRLNTFLGVSQDINNE